MAAAPLTPLGRRALRPPFGHWALFFFFYFSYMFITVCSLVSVVSWHTVCSILRHKHHYRVLQTVQVLNSNEPVAISSALISPPYPSGPLLINAPSQSLISASMPPTIKRYATLLPLSPLGLRSFSPFGRRALLSATVGRGPLSPLLLKTVDSCVDKPYT